jgi:hypothetical protein
VGLELVVKPDIEIKVIADVVTEIVSIGGDMELVTPFLGN